MRCMQHVRLLAFDVFGTVVDWHGSIAREVAARWPQVDAAAFANAWRAGYRPAMAEVMASGTWVGLDALHRQILNRVLPQFGLHSVGNAERDELNRAWHRLDAWPDSAPGIARLQRRYTVCTLSNGPVALLVALARRNGVPWDCVLSGELFRAYKPDARVYEGAAALMGLQPHQCALVAAHHDDLAAARACGWRTAYIERPFEFGAAEPKDVSPQPGNTVHAGSILGLADVLGCCEPPHPNRPA